MMTHSVFYSFFSLAQAPVGGIGPFLPMILIIAGMYFFIIAPQRKRQKAIDAMQRALKSGDAIVTTGGIHGTVTNVKDDIVVVRIADNVKIEMSRNSIATVTPKDEAA